MLGQTKRLRILDGSTTNRTAGRPSASRKGVCHDRIERATRGQVVFLQNYGELFPAHSARLGPDGVGLPLGSPSTVPENDCRRGARGSVPCGHDLAPPRQSPMADARLVRRPVRQPCERCQRLGTAAGERKTAAMDRGHRHDLPFHDVGANGELDRHVEAARIRRGRRPTNTPSSWGWC